jgi:hypothetical protein
MIHQLFAPAEWIVGFSRTASAPDHQRHQTHQRTHCHGTHNGASVPALTDDPLMKYFDRPSGASKIDIDRCDASTQARRSCEGPRRGARAKVKRTAEPKVERLIEAPWLQGRLSELCSAGL